MTTRSAAFTGLLTGSYVTLVGVPLVPEGIAGDAAAAWMYDAPFGLLAQDTSPDPVFTYANRIAQELFGYTWDEFVGLPSRLSAAAGQDRDERRSFMEAVRRQGYADNYRGPRIARSGRRFWIRDTTVWNLISPDSALIGQAALIRNWADA